MWNLCVGFIKGVWLYVKVYNLSIIFPCQNYIWKKKQTKKKHFHKIFHGLALTSAARSSSSYTSSRSICHATRRLKRAKSCARFVTTSLATRRTASRAYAISTWSWSQWKLANVSATYTSFVFPPIKWSCSLSCASRANFTRSPFRFTPQAVARSSSSRMYANV